VVAGTDLQPAGAAAHCRAPQPAPQAEKPAPAVSARPQPARAAVAQVDSGTVGSSGRVAVINVKCDSRLASCRRWIDQQVAKLSKVAAVSGRPGA
jgi:hypothetical protein